MAVLGIISTLKFLVGMMVRLDILAIRCMVMMHGWVEIVTNKSSKIDRLLYLVMPVMS